MARLRDLRMTTKLVAAFGVLVTSTSTGVCRLQNDDIV